MRVNDICAVLLLAWLARTASAQAALVASRDDGDAYGLHMARARAMRTAPALIIVGAALFAWPGRSASQAHSLSATDPRSALAQRIEDLAASAPPELGAYARLKLVETNSFPASDNARRSSAESSNRGTDKAVAIRTAFNLAGSSPYPVRMSFISGNLDTRSGFLSYSYDLELDALSLKTRAVAAMLPIDPKQALEMFRQIGPLHLTPLPCRSRLAYDVAAYYKVAGALFARAFDPDDRRKDLDVAFLESVLAAVAHPAELVPAEELVLMLDFKANPDKLARADAALSRALAQINADPRSYNASEVAFITNLFRLEDTQHAAIRPLLAAAREYIENNLSGTVCSDALDGRLPPPGQPVHFAYPRKYADLNRVLLPKYDLPPIDMASIRPTSLGEGRAADESEAYWQSPTSSHLHGALRQLSQTARTDRRVTPEWQRALEQFLGEVRSWTDPSTEPSSADFYIEKSLLLSRPLSLASPETAAFQDVLESYLEFLNSTPPDPAIQVFWIWNVAQLVREQRSGAGTPSAAISQLEKALASSPNPTIELWADLATLDQLGKTH